MGIDLSSRIRHQLMIHLDYGKGIGGLEIRYSYPFAGPHSLREQLIKYRFDQIEVGLKEMLDNFVELIKARTPKTDIAVLPHAEVTPDILHGLLTFVVQDQQRAETVPMARLLYHEKIEPVGSQVERKIHVKRPEFSDDELALAEGIRTIVKGIGWAAYCESMGDLLKPD